MEVIKQIFIEKYWYKTVPMDSEYSEYRVGYYDKNSRFVYHNPCGPAFASKNGYLYEMHDCCITWEVEKWLEERNLDINNMSDEDTLAMMFFTKALYQNIKDE